MLSLPRTAAPHAGAGAVLKIIRATGRSTRAELAEATGLSRSSLSDRLDALMASELVREAGLLPSNGGRPRSTLELNPSGGLLLVADVGATRTRLALLDLAATALGEVSETIAVADGPSAVLEGITRVASAACFGRPAAARRSSAGSPSASPARCRSPPAGRCTRL